jgi:protein-S-isoprenylcysteine O-methyltransferase Ste14
MRGFFLMLAATANFVAGHRISVSRAFGVMFFITVLVCDSAHEGTIVAPVLFLSGLVLIGIATVGRLWCSLYISGYKNSQLVTAGPYSMCRNPLYFFSFLGFVGIGLATETASIPLALIVAVLLVYPHVIKREEAHLRSKFGEAFTRYAAGRREYCRISVSTTNRIVTQSIQSCSVAQPWMSSGLYGSSGSLNS